MDISVKETSITTVKAVLVGDAACGKTCLAIASTKREYPKQIDNTTNQYTTVVRHNGRQMELTLWDTSGQDEGDRNRASAYQNTDVFLVCFSIISPFSFENVRTKWVPEIRRYSSPEKPLILVGCKVDLRNDPESLERLSEKKLAAITYDQGLKMQKEIKAVAYIECSAVEMTRLDELTRTILETVAPTTRQKKGKTKKLYKKFVNIDIVVDKNNKNNKSQQEPKEKNCSLM
jgi:small GTP-binding protein